LKYAVIDIGSNSIRMSVYEPDETCELNTIQHFKGYAGLAGYVDARQNLSMEGVMRACEILLGYKKTLTLFPVDQVFVFATASLRNIRNREEALDLIRERVGLDVAILSGEEEAMCALAGAGALLTVLDGVLLDIGGGSTEVVLCRGGEAEFATSVPLGSLNMHVQNVRYILPNKKEGKAIQQEARTAFELLNKSSFPEIYGVGGTMRAIYRLTNSLYSLSDDNRVIEMEQLAEMYKLLRKGERRTLTRVLRLMPERAHTLLPGMAIVKMAASVFGCERVLVSDYGVREGYLLRRVLWGTSE